jgi:hypothetical protein
VLRHKTKNKRAILVVPQNRRDKEHHSRTDEEHREMQEPGDREGKAIKREE